MSSVQIRNFAARQIFLDPKGGGPLAIGLDADMQHVLDVWAALDPKPIEKCSAAEARAQPTLARALARLLGARPVDDDVAMELRLIPGAAGDIRARVYSPTAGRAAPTPLILYLHGGGWVVGDLDSYDATPRALARRTGAIVVSAHYRQAPEFQFPAAHEDAYRAWQWLVEHAAALGGDARRAAVAGEGAGANLAVNVALRAHQEGGIEPVHQLLVTPMVGGPFTLPSYLEHQAARPLGAAAVRWFMQQACRRHDDWQDPRIRLAERGDLAGLPPATIILAEIDPLRSEGEALADALRRSGVWVDCTIYDGVTHQFFGLGQVVNKAMFAQSQASANLTGAFRR